MQKNITNNIMYIGKFSRKCDCCGVYKVSGFFYNWFSTIRKDEYNKPLLLGVICYKCGIREGLGGKSTKKYKKWMEMNNEQK